MLGIIIHVCININFVPAIDGNDYVGFSLRLTFQAGSSGGSSQCTAVQILDDNLLEDDESFFLSTSLVNPIPTGVVIGQSTATATIIDNESKRKYSLRSVHNCSVCLHFSILLLIDITYEFTQFEVSVQENSGPLQVSIRLSASSGIPLSPFTVFVNTRDLTAQSMSSLNLIYKSTIQ